MGGVRRPAVVAAVLPAFVEPLGDDLFVIDTGFDPISTPPIW
jgi:hypothetical protein